MGGGLDGYRTGRSGHHQVEDLVEATVDLINEGRRQIYGTQIAGVVDGAPVPAAEISSSAALHHSADVKASS